MEKLQNKYRFERKYIIQAELLDAFLFELLNHGYSEIFEQRQINNIYLDDYDYTNVWENVEGISNRTKSRIRWYGEQFSDSKKTVEFKIKSNDVNRKEALHLGESQLKSFDNIDAYWDNIQTTMIANKEEKFYTQKLFALRPTLLNSYSRNYFVNADQSIRITVDQNLFYYSPLTYTEAMDTSIIIEIKYNSEYIPSDNLFSNLILTKHSKYIKGILMTSTFKAIY